MSCEHVLPSDMGYGLPDTWDAEMEAEYQDHVAAVGLLVCGTGPLVGHGNGVRDRT